MQHSDNVRVVVRARPVEPPENEDISLDPERNIVKVRLPNRQKYICFKFNKVFSSKVTQEIIFEDCLAGFIKGALEGLNGTVMAYGQVSRV